MTSAEVNLSPSRTGRATLADQVTKVGEGFQHETVGEEVCRRPIAFFAEHVGPVPLPIAHIEGVFRYGILVALRDLRVLAGGVPVPSEPLVGIGQGKEAPCRVDLR